MLAVFFTAAINSYVDRQNAMFVTNRRLIQKITPSLFSNSVNVIELTKIEDISFHKTGFIAHVLRFGTLRISTVGDETTYTFPFLDTPTDEVEIISDLITKSRDKSENPANTP
jgi:hypothetical protein